MSRKDKNDHETTFLIKKKTTFSFQLNEHLKDVILSTFLV